MSQITVTLPDGSSRELPAGARVRDVAESISPRLAKAALAAVVDGRLVDLTYPSPRTRRWHRPERAGACADRHSPAHRWSRVTNLFSAAVRHWPGNDEVFVYDSCTGPFVPGSADYRRRCGSWGRRLGCERQLWRASSEAFFAARGEPLKSAIDETPMVARGVLLPIKDKETFIASARPARAVHRPAQGINLLNRRTPTGKGDARTQPIRASTDSFAEKELKSYLTQLRARSAITARSEELGCYVHQGPRPPSGRKGPRSTTPRNYMRDVLLRMLVAVKTPISQQGPVETSVPGALR